MRIRLISIVLALGLMSAAIVNAALVAPATQSIGFDMKAYEHDRVVGAADKYLSIKPITITAFPATRSAGGLHDFYSEADYFWPNPNNPNGVYIDRDGMSNPDNFLDHRKALFAMCIQVPALTDAYLITGEQKYADHAIEHLMAWFVNPDTMMNPSLPYAQAVRGGVTGRSYGIIDTLHLVEVARSVVVLREHHAISAEDDKAITAWFAKYLDWLTTSKFGITEGSSKNNHATCFWLQVAEFATLTGNNADLDEARRRYKTQLLPQMAPDGSFPAELTRTKPYGYSIFDLDQMVMLCEVLSTPQDDLWHFALPTGQTIAKGAAYMYPFIKDKSLWKLKPDVMVYNLMPVRSETWILCGQEFNEPKYIELWKSLEANPTNDEVLRNLPIRQPVLWTE